MRTRFGTIICVFGLLAALTGCGGSGNDSPAITPPPASGSPPPPPPPPPPVIGMAGGIVTGGGATVVVPAGAIDADTTIRIAMDSTGAPALPTALVAAGNTYVITPHGGDFKQLVEVRIPVPAVTLLPTQQLKIAKAQPNGEWMVLNDTRIADGMMSADVGSFSFFMSVVITYPLPILQAEPLALSVSLACQGQPCDGVLRTATATYTAVGNNGAIPFACQNSSLAIYTNEFGDFSGNVYPIARTGGSVTETVNRTSSGRYSFGAAIRCDGFITNFGYGWIRSITFAPVPPSPVLAIMYTPSQLDVVEGTTATLEAVIGGGAGRLSRAVWTPATYYDHAIIDWQRSDDGGLSWRDVAHSYENEANPLPFGTGAPGRPWSVSHGFVATTADQGQLLRIHACYTPPGDAASAQPCLYSVPTRINVLQQSALPAIVTAPRSVLVRSGQTASLSVTASGAPAPTLQWQSRAANSSGAWSDVTTGTGATTANYTTAANAIPDNGTQYRVVATNAVGTAQSTAVTISVSDLEVAPSITTQPASLSVTSGNDAVFAAVAHGTEALSYQWRFNGANIAGANNPVLRLSAVTSANAGAYNVTVTNSAGNVASDTAMLNVTAGTPAVVAPSIVTQPVSVTANEGNTATFAVGVDGSGPLSFQWRRNGVNMAGATSASLTFNSVALPNAGSYSVVVTNSAASVASNSVALDVAPAVGYLPPSITSQPSTVIVAAGGSATLAVGAAGSGPLSYQWSLSGTAIPGATLPVLTISNVGDADVGNYTVSVDNGTDSVNSQVAQLILLGAPQITQQPSATTAYEGQSATFSVSANGSGLRYQWMLNGSPISGATEAGFTTPTLVTGNTGAVYSVAVYNGAGLVSSQAAVLTVQANVIPTVLQQPANASIQPGQSAALCVAFSGTLPLTLHMQRWNGASWTSALDILATSNSTNCFSTPVLTLAETGAQFRFAADNPAGQVYTNTVTVTVTAPVTFVTTMASRTSTGAMPNNRSSSPSISADGSLVAFTSDGNDLVPGFGGSFGHGYVRNLRTGVTVAVDQKPDGSEPVPYGVGEMKISASGRYVVFTSLAAGLVPADTNNAQDVFLRDLQTGTTKQLTLFPDGSGLVNAGNGSSEAHLDISADGRYVLFASAYDFTQDESVQVPVRALFLRDTLLDHTTLLVSHPTDAFGYTALASGGEYLAYSMAHFSPDVETVHVMDLETLHDTTIFTLDHTTTAEYLHQGMAIDRNGRHVAFALHSPVYLSTAVTQILVVDVLHPEILTIASRNTADSGNDMGDGQSTFPKLSPDGRYVLFNTSAGNISGATGGLYDTTVMIRDTQLMTTKVVSRRANGTRVPTAGSFLHAISEDMTTAAFVAGSGAMGDGGTEFQVYAATLP